MSSRPSRPMRVLALFSEVHGNGGIQRFNRTLLAACARLGIDCDVLSLHDARAADAADAAGCGGSRVRFALRAARRLATRRYDWLLVGHVNFLALAVALRVLATPSRPRVMLAAHGIEVWSGIGARRRWALAHTDRILCVSRHTRDRLLEQAPGLDPADLMRFPNALAETWRGVAPVDPREPLPPRFILSVTRLSPGDRYKGVVSVIEALRAVEDPGLDYLVVGSGEDRAFLELVARRCGVADRVHFRPDTTDAELADLYRRCHAFVLPSGNEGFGIVYLEAMFFGAPVIAAAA
ncbi:MAG: glycosyltransferase family 4 protein, partial [Gammaproteobacteria bacterium]|nr:glycosyltransferase family 4 protein [Gammaproteobacteria bacterium]